MKGFFRPSTVNVLTTHESLFTSQISALQMLKGRMMKILIFGATGMVGQSALRECLLAEDVEAVTAVGRSTLDVQHPKLKQVAHSDMLDLAPVETSLGATLAGADLTDADLRDSVLIDTGFTGSNLTNADFTGTTFRGVRG
jgi:uncharacterized protein YbjT (DUF2867 family)